MTEEPSALGFAFLVLVIPNVERNLLSAFARFKSQIFPVRANSRLKRKATPCEMNRGVADCHSDAGGSFAERRIQIPLPSKFPVACGLAAARHSTARHPHRPLPLVALKLSLYPQD